VWEHFYCSTRVHTLHAWWAIPFVFHSVKVILFLLDKNWPKSIWHSRLFSSVYTRVPQWVSARMSGPQSQYETNEGVTIEKVFTQTGTPGSILLAQGRWSKAKYAISTKIYLIVLIRTVEILPILVVNPWAWKIMNWLWIMNTFPVVYPSDFVVVYRNCNLPSLLKHGLLRQVIWHWKKAHHIRNTLYSLLEAGCMSMESKEYFQVWSYFCLLVPILRHI